MVAFGPFYLVAIYAFIRGRKWIRLPALVWAGVMMTNVAIILFEEREGIYDTVGAIRTVAVDLGTDAGLDALFAATADLSIGLVVCDAAYAPIGAFLDRDEADLRRAIDLNCVAPVRIPRHYLPAMIQPATIPSAMTEPATRGRGRSDDRRGGLIILSSLAGQQGSPGISTYAATKAFGAVFAEGLWAEMRAAGTGIDVLVCAPGAVETPGLARSKSRRAPGTVTPDVVAASALRALGRRPRTVPGGLMKISAAVTGRLLSRRAAIALIARASGDLSDGPL